MRPLHGGGPVGGGRSSVRPGRGGEPLSLSDRLVLALSAAGLLLLALIVTAGVLLLQVRQLQQRVVGDYYTASSTSDALFVQLVDAETAVRGYALTGSPDFLAPFRSTPAEQAKSVKAFASLQRELAEDPALLAALGRATASAQIWRTRWADPVVAQVGARGPGAVTTAQVERGKTLFDQVRRDYNVYREGLLDRRTAVLDDLQLRTDALIGALFLAGLGGVVVGAGLWIALRQWITRPVDALTVETRAVTGGDLGRTVSVTGPPEFVRLAADVDAMRAELLGQLHAVQAARGEVDTARQRLEVQAVELRQSNQELEQFAYVASHDLQEPLRKVASFCQMLERRYAGQLDERADQYIAFAVDGAKRMQALINDLLAFSRVGRLTGEPSVVSLDDCLRHALRNLDAAREESAAQVTSDPLPEVEGEVTLLTQVFQNLVGNAIKFRGDVPPRVRIGVRREGDDWELSCADNGIGIEPQYAERIFVIFQRLHPKDQYEGTGIGLAMCRKIVEYHGGRMWLDPEVASGTVFRWTLPVIGTRPAATAEPQHLSSPAAAAENPPAGYVIASAPTERTSA